MVWNLNEHVTWRSLTGMASDAICEKIHQHFRSFPSTKFFFSLNDSFFRIFFRGILFSLHLIHRGNSITCCGACGYGTSSCGRFPKRPIEKSFFFIWLFIRPHPDSSPRFLLPAIYGCFFLVTGEVSRIQRRIISWVNNNGRPGKPWRSDLPRGFF